MLQSQKDYTKLILQIVSILCDSLDLFYNLMNNIKSRQFVKLFLCNLFVTYLSFYYVGYFADPFMFFI